MLLALLARTMPNTERLVQPAWVLMQEQVAADGGWIYPTDELIDRGSQRYRNPSHNVRDEGGYLRDQVADTTWAPGVCL